MLLFALGERTFGLAVEHVAEVAQAAAVTPLPGAPPGVDGTIDLRGTALPVLDLREVLGLPGRPLDPSQHFVVTAAGGQPLVLRVDRVLRIEEDAEPVAATDRVHRTAAAVAGLVRTREGLVLLQDLERLLSPEDRDALRDALDAFLAEGS